MITQGTKLRAFSPLQQLLWWYPRPPSIREVSRWESGDLVKVGHAIFNAPDWRPPTVSLIAFALKGPPRLEEPRGSVSFAVV